MSPRTGRPKSDNPKTFEVKARITRDVNEKLDEYCKKNNLTKTQVIRLGLDLVLGQK